MVDCNKSMEYIRTLPEGKICDVDAGQVRLFLSKYWGRLSGSDDTSMDQFKLHRIENIRYIP